MIRRRFFVHVSGTKRQCARLSNNNRSRASILLLPGH